MTQFEEKNGMFNGDFHMEFCDNKRQLFQAYFRDFTIERLDRPWKAFTGGWHPDVAAKKLGINSSFIHGDYCYVLVRVSRFRESSQFTQPIPANQILEDNIRMEIGKLIAPPPETQQFVTICLSVFSQRTSPSVIPRRLWSL